MNGILHGYMFRFHQANLFQYLNHVSSWCSFRAHKHKMFILSCTWVRQMPWVTPTVAGFICDRASPHSKPIAKTSCVFVKYLRTKLHTHRYQLIHYLPQSNREPKIVFSRPFYRNITSKRYVLLHYLSLHIVSLPWHKYCRTCILPPPKFTRSMRCSCWMQEIKYYGIEVNQFKCWNGDIHGQHRDHTASFRLLKISICPSTDKIFYLSLFPVAFLPSLFAPFLSFKASGKSYKILNPDITNRHK
jgi:hypothetical protein